MMKVICNISGLILLALVLIISIPVYSPVFIILILVLSVVLWYVLFYFLLPIVLSIKSMRFSMDLRKFHIFLLIFNLLGISFCALLLPSFHPNSSNFIGLPSLYLYYFINKLIFKKENLWKENE